MDKTVQTLFAPFRPLPEGIGVFLNARVYKGLPVSMVLQQGFKPHVHELVDQGFSLSPDFPQGIFAQAFVLLPKNMIEARYVTAQALELLSAAGVIAIAAANDAGGKRVGKILEEFGVRDVQDYAANHARVAWGVKPQEINEAVREALEAGKPRLLESGFMSQPGLFAWDRIDAGSSLLAECLPRDFHGSGADFGCGYGFLSRFVLEGNSGIRNFICIDADRRAVKLCEENVKNRTGAKLDFLWADLTRDVPPVKNLDFIIMNPPFHEGKETDSDIGLDFIRTAKNSLRQGGQLWMVANAELPYEKALGEFSGAKKIAQKNGFKVFRAVR